MRDGCPGEGKGSGNDWVLPACLAELAIFPSRTRIKKKQELGLSPARQEGGALVEELTPDFSNKIPNRLPRFSPSRSLTEIVKHEEYHQYHLRRLSSPQSV